MARIRTIYNAEQYFVGPTPATGYHYQDNNIGFLATGTTVISQLNRVQSANFSAATPRRDVFQFGELGAIDRLIVDSPSVELQLTYLLPNLANERLLGFTISSGILGESTAISGLLTKTSDEKNYFAKVYPEGQDAINNSITGGFYILGFGNMTVASYTSEGAVGDFPRATVSLQGLNMKFDSWTGLNIPAVDPTNGNAITNVKFSLPTGTSNPTGLAATNYSVLQPGDVNLSIASFGEGFVDTNDWKIQNYQVSFDLSRTEIGKLGSKFAVSKEIETPVTANLRVTAIVGDYATGSISTNVLRNTPYDVTIAINKPAFSYGTAVADAGVAVQYKLKKAYLDSQEYSLDIGGNKQVTMNFVCPISGPSDKTRGIFFSGIN